MRIRAAASVLFSLLLAWTTSLGAQTPEPLAQLVADWETAFNAGDVDGVVALYTSDAIRAPPEEELISGPDEIKAGLEASAGLTIKLTTAERACSAMKWAAHGAPTSSRGRLGARASRRKAGG